MTKRIRRTQWEIYFEIIQTLHNREGILISDLMDKTNTTHGDLTDFLSHLGKKGLVEIIPGGGNKRIVKITGKGEEVFKELKELMTMIKKLLV